MIRKQYAYWYYYTLLNDVEDFDLVDKYMFASQKNVSMVLNILHFQNIAVFIDEISSLRKLINISAEFYGRGLI